MLVCVVSSFSYSMNVAFKGRSTVRTGSYSLCEHARDVIKVII